MIDLHIPTKVQKFLKASLPQPQLRGYLVWQGSCFAQTAAICPKSDLRLQMQLGTSSIKDSHILHSLLSVKFCTSNQSNHLLAGNTAYTIHMMNNIVN